MSAAKQLGLVIVSLLFIVSVVGANGVVATDRTVIEADHISETFEDEGVYQSQATEARDELGEELDTQLEDTNEEAPTGITIDIDTATLTEDAVTEEYIATEIERNIESFIAFLEGETEELALSINLEPIQATISEQFDADAITVDTSALMQSQEVDTEEAGVEIDNEMLVRLNEDQEGYTAVRLEMREQAVEEIPAELDDDGSVSVDAVEIAKEVPFESSRVELDISDDDIERLNEGPVGYTEVRSDIRAQVRSQLPPTATDGDLDGEMRRLNQELRDNAEADTRNEYGDEVSEETVENMVALQHTVIDGLTDPDLNEFDDYETRRDADEAALEASLENELNEKIQEAGTELKTTAAAEIEAEYGTDLSEQTMEDVVALQDTVIDGLTDPDLGNFDDYETRRTENEAAVEGSLATEIQAEIDEEFDEEIDLSEDFDEESSEMENLQSGVGLLNTMLLVLPLAALGLVGGVFALTRSVNRTISTTGYSLLVAGVIGTGGGLVGSRLAFDFFESAVDPDGEAAEAAFFDGVIGVIESLFDVLVAQSLVLVGLGVVLIGIAYADRAGYFDGLMD